MRVSPEEEEGDHCGAYACLSAQLGHMEACVTNWEGCGLAKDKAAKCCRHPIHLGDSSMRLSTHTGNYGVR